MSRLRRKSEIRAAAEHKASVFSQFRRGSSPMAACWRGVMIEALRGGQSVSAAARSAGVSRQAAYRALARDHCFAAAWDEAFSERLSCAAGDPLAPEIVPIFRGGLQVGYKVRHDNARLLRLLRGATRAGATLGPSSTMDHNALTQFLADIPRPLSPFGDTCAAGAINPTSAL